MQHDSPGLARRLGVNDAVLIGMGSMIGAGVFSVFAPAAGVAGMGLLMGLAIAAVVSFCNATSSGQLAAQYPSSGGSYLYGRERLGHWPGFFAGWSFVVGKTASCAAMALVFAEYAAPSGWQKPVAVAAVVALATVNCLGITRTVALTRVIVTTVLAVLALVIVAGLSGWAGNDDGSPLADSSAGAVGAVGAVFDSGWYGILQSAGLLFFAFAGYARLATLGEEVKDPEKTIPRAIVGALCITLVLYLVVAVTALGSLGPAQLAASGSPLVDIVRGRSWDWAAPLVQLGAAAASLGALLALMAGIGRTTLAMARNGDLPRWLAAVHPRFRVPHRAELALMAATVALVLTVDLRGAIGFSAFGVLLYYLVANAAAFTQTGAARRYPKAAQVLGAIGCLVLVATLPLPSIVGGIVVLFGGILYRLLTSRMRRQAPARTLS